MNKAVELRKKFMAKARNAVKEKFEGEESHIIKAVLAAGALDEISNVLFEQTREWYALHFPELERKARDPETYLKLAGSLGDRKNFEKNAILAICGKEGLAEETSNLANNSMGGDAAEETIVEIKELAKTALGLKEERRRLNKYLESAATKAMPNFSRLAGGLLSAKMLAKAGSLKKLALMPSSTIQILGADKAIFAHLKAGAKSPKHGIIYQHPIVGGAPRNLKGKAAKLVASKLAIAAKADYFSKKFIAGELEKDMRDKAARLINNQKKDNFPDLKTGTSAKFLVKKNNQFPSPKSIQQENRTGGGSGTAF